MAPAESEWEEELRRGAAELHVLLGEREVQKFAVFLDTLLLWSETTSLIATTGRIDLVRKHVLDSLHVAPFVPDEGIVADLGSGAGFPGIPLAIVRPRSTLLLVESRRKRANFLRDVARRADLRNVQVVEDRIEELSGNLPRCDVVVSRAVWPLSTYVALAEGLVGSNGLLIAMKGPAPLTVGLPSGATLAEPQRIEYSLADGRRRVLVIYRKR